MNEAAERLRRNIHGLDAILFDEALAAERRATVEAVIEDISGRYHGQLPIDAIDWGVVRSAILDEEAAR